LIACFIGRARPGFVGRSQGPRGELVLGTEMQYAPFEFLDNNTPKGYSIDLFSLVAADLGVKNAISGSAVRERYSGS